MTNEQKDNLTGLCKIEIKRWKEVSESNPNMRYMVELMEVALASLNEKPYGFVHNMVDPPGCGVAASIFKEENRHYGRPVFTRPAPAVSMAELVPQERSYDQYIDTHNFMTMDEALNLAREWNACRAAMLRNIEEAK